MSVRRVLPPVLILAMVAGGILVAPALPDRVPIHWNLAGEPDGWGGRWVAALGLPTVALAVWGLMAVLERLLLRDPEAGAARRAMGHLQLTLVLVWIVLYGATLAPPLGYSLPLDPTGIALLALGLFLAATGTLFGRLAGAVGGDALVKLPTADAAVKRDVLRGAGRLLVVAGAAMAVAAPFGPTTRLGLLLASFALPAVALPVYVLVRLSGTDS